VVAAQACDRRLWAILQPNGSRLPAVHRVVRDARIPVRLSGDNQDSNAVGGTKGATTAR